MGSERGLGQAMLLIVAALGCVLVLPSIARAGETAPGSAEALKLEAPDARAVGMPMPLTVEGTADGLHRLFVYGEADREEGCQTWPYQEQTQEDAVTLTSTGGEPLSAGHFSKSFVVVPASEWYGVCAYLGTTASANPDVFDYGCYQMPAHIVHFPEAPNLTNCYMSYAPWWVTATLEQGAKEQLEKARAERTHREELEEAERRQHEEAAGHEALQEAEQRRAVEEGDRHGLRESVAIKVCRVPALRRHTLAGTRRLLRDADCRLGRVRTDRGDGKLVVERQSPNRGKTLPHGAAVSIVLGPSAA
jgi:hypothetical protein